MGMRRVVVTGLGALTPLGNSVQDYWNGLVQGRSGAAPITRFDASKFRTQFAAEVKGFDPENHMDRKEARKMDPYTQYAMVTAEEAFNDAGLHQFKIDGERAGVIWGSGIGGLYTVFHEFKSYFEGDGTPKFNPFFVPKMISDIAAGYLSIRYGFHGPNYTTVSACASSNNAIIDAFNYIRWGVADLFITGGSEAAVNEPGVAGFNAMKALSERNDDPATASRPFDLNRDGFVLGEGGAALILESLDHALARGARIYAEIGGAGLSADAHHITAPHPEGLGATLVMRNALRDAGLVPSEIDYINVHGTSTPLGDLSEIKAIQNVFGEDAYRLNVSSTKSMTGHLLGAAGAAEAVASILAIVHGTVPPTINHFTDDPAFDPRINLTFNTPQSRTIRAALSNTFGFGGHNTSVVFKAYQA
ncbi:MAG: beta-ketoacyl-[acyl-carrier-protein] synthase II [Sphingobacteriia bacterium]|nr:beta-ketoacyl-[acyl-carrier-protein] synthase II [Sphingobacteriia bacterium]